LPQIFTKTNNDPHQAWDEYIKYFLLSGKKMPDDINGIKDFIKASEPQEKRKVKRAVKSKPVENITMSVNEVIIQIKHDINLYNDNMIFYKNKSDDYMFNLSCNSRETLRVLLSNITNTEYVYKPDII
jgi:hypothetical protein